MTKLEKLQKARELIMEVEDECIEDKGYCPYEIGYTLRNLEKTIELFTKA